MKTALSVSMNSAVVVCICFGHHTTTATKTVSMSTFERSRRFIVVADKFKTFLSRYHGILDDAMASLFALSLPRRAHRATHACECPPGRPHRFSPILTLNSLDQPMMSGSDCPKSEHSTSCNCDNSVIDNLISGGIYTCIILYR